MTKNRSIKKINWAGERERERGREREWVKVYKTKWKVIFSTCCVYKNNEGCKQFITAITLVLLSDYALNIIIIRTEKEFWKYKRN